MSKKEASLEIKSSFCFENWILSNIDIFDKVTVDVYKTYWSAWEDWLFKKGRTWLEVDVSIIEIFFNGPTPSEKTNRTPNWPDRMALSTSQRYWRVLKGVYNEAVKIGFLEKNPFFDLEEQKRPVVPISTRTPQVLPPGVLEQLRQPDVLKTIFSSKKAADGEGNGWPWRDRAAMSVLANTGITTSEMIRLRGHHVEVEQDGTAYLKVPHDDDLFGRRLLLSHQVMEVLQPWLTVRQRLLKHKLAPKKRGPQADPQELATACKDAPLFMSRQSKSEERWFPPLEPSSVYVFVRRGLRRLYAQGRTPDISLLKVAKGGAIIRNTVIQDWILTEGLEEAALKGGFSSSNYLGVLWKHLF